MTKVVNKLFEISGWGGRPTVAGTIPTTSASVVPTDIAPAISPCPLQRPFDPEQLSQRHSKRRFQS